MPTNSTTASNDRTPQTAWIEADEANALIPLNATDFVSAIALICLTIAFTML